MKQRENKAEPKLPYPISALSDTEFFAGVQLQKRNSPPFTLTPTPFPQHEQAEQNAHRQNKVNRTENGARQW